MASKIITKGLKRTALSVALGMCFAGSVYAQSNSTGSIAGNTKAGSTVVIENPATGFRREVTADANGNYRVSSLQTGSYNVTSGGKTNTVEVSIGGTAQGTTSLGTVTVQGSVVNPIDVASVESTTVLTAAQIAKIPVVRDITAVALLAPGTVRGDSAFGNLASFGGSSVAENQYYVNGFNISNAFKGLDFGQVPFEAIAEQQVKTGGYGAEFGRSTGGVINLVTKRGSNEFHAGGNIFWTPESLRSQDPNVYTNAGFLGRTNSTRPSYLFGDNSQDSDGTQRTASVWASGALIKDRLFAYALLQYGRTTGIEDYGNAFTFNRRGQVATNSESNVKAPNWLLKMDWSINDSNSLELTAFKDTRKTQTDVFDNPSAGNANCTPAQIAVPGSACNLQPYPDASKVLQRGAYKGSFFDETGGQSYSLKYTGYLTDSFTLSALYGRGESKRSQTGAYANGLFATYNGDIAVGATGCPSVTDFSGDGILDAFNPCAFFGSIGSPLNKDTRDQFRIDADWSLGAHLVRFGIDYDRFTSRDATDLEGGHQYSLLGKECTDIVIGARVEGDCQNNSGTNNGDNVPLQNVVERVTFRNGAQVQVKSTAFYLEDTWNITNNFLVYGGLRSDSFKNLNGDGKAYVDVKNQIAPRLGFSWDVNGDSSFKVYGNAGRYFLPLSSTVAIRGASASIYADDLLTYTTLAPLTSEPQGLALFQSSYLNGENGLPKAPNSIATKGLKPQYQDEFIAGFQFKLTDHVSAGMRGVYRDLKSAIDDFCDYRYFAQVATDKGLTFDPSRLNYCHLYNPGKDSVFLADVTGSGTFTEIAVPHDYYRTLRRNPTDPTSPLRFTAAEAALIDKGATAKRNYKALEFFAEGHWDKFFMQGSYTWAKSYGNFEGGVKSDIGQSDTGTTQDFDYPELEAGTTGYLPNDRRHSFKLFGNYEFTDEWSMGFNALVQSGRPLNCFGIKGNDPVGYRNSYYSCDPLVGIRSRQDGTGGLRYDNGSTQGNRGDRGRTEWQRNLDLNVAYKPHFADGHLIIKADVFNVLNEHAATSQWERGEGRDGRPAQDTYLLPTSFQAPRSFRLLVQYDY